MEARAGNSILDFETVFSDFQELLNGSGLTLVAGLNLLQEKVSRFTNSPQNSNPDDLFQVMSK